MSSMVYYLQKYFEVTFIMEFYILTALTVISFVYCCDAPVLFGMEFLINQKDSIWYAIGCSIIASYIFYCIQVVLPQKYNEKRAYDILSRKITNLVSEAYHLFVFCNNICKIDTANDQITIPTVYVINIVAGKENPWIEKIMIDTLAIRINNAKKVLREDSYYMQLSFRIRKALQPLIDNQFPERLVSSIKHAPIIDVDLINFYNDYQVRVAHARKVLKQTEEQSMIPFNDEIRIAEFEHKLSMVDPAFLRENPTFIPHMKIK